MYGKWGLLMCFGANIFILAVVYKKCTDLFGLVRAITTINFFSKFFSPNDNMFHF